MNDNKYDIKDLENLTGIKAHTLRIWEQRYNILKPHRTETNIRYYSNDDLKRILNISLLNKNGRKISKIADLSDEEIIKEVTDITLKSENVSDQIESLIISMVELEEERFEKTINSSILRIGLINTIQDVLFPFLQKIGTMWQTGAINPAQEHFISNLIRQKIIVAIDGQVVKHNYKTKKVVLYLPEGELHEISLLFYSYLLRNKNHHVIYLGQSVPLEDMKRINEIRKPHYLVTIITQPFKDFSTAEYLKNISKAFSTQHLLVSGYQVYNQQELPKFKNISYFKTPNEFIELIDKL